MELRPRKGRSAHTPSTPTVAKPSPRHPPKSTARKKPSSAPSSPPVFIASDDKGTDPQQKASSPAPNQEDPLPVDTPLSDFVKSRRKTAASSTKQKKKPASTLKTKAIEVSPVAEHNTTSMEEASTVNDCNVSASVISRSNLTATCVDISAVEDTKAAEEAGAKSSIELDGEEFVRKDKYLQSAKKSGHTERPVGSTGNGEILDEVGNVKLENVDGQDHCPVADAPVMAVLNECCHQLSLVLSDDENAEVSSAMHLHVCEGKEGQVVRSSSKKKSRSKMDNFIEENINRKLFEENATIVLSINYREPKDRLEYGTCSVACPSKHDETEMDDRSIREAGEKLNSQEQAGKPYTQISTKTLQSDNVMLAINEAHRLNLDQEVEGKEFGNELTGKNLPGVLLPPKSDAIQEGEDFDNDCTSGSVFEESSKEECERDEDLSIGHDDFLELKLNEAKEGFVHHTDHCNFDDGSSDSASSGSDEDEGDLASIFANSMKAHLHISEPSVVGKYKEMQPELNVGNERESPSIKDAAKGPIVSGSRSVRSELAWLPNVPLLTPKNHRPQARILGPRPNVWEKDRCLQDGLCVPPINPVKLNKLAKKQKKDTAGDKWYNISAPTITPELKKELQLVKLRGVLDPKRHYKAEDSKGLPKYFQVGTVVGGPADFYSGRLTKKEQKASLANELISDSSLSTYRKRKYLEIQDQKQAGGKGFWKKKKSKRTPAWAKI